MNEVTVKKLAEDVGTPVELLLKQFKSAGVDKEGADDPVTPEEKESLLKFLRTSHGAKEDAPRKITLKRKTHSELRLPGSGNNTRTPLRGSPAGRGGKTVAVEVRRKRTFVKQGVVSESDQINNDAEKARRALDEQAEQQRKNLAEDEARRSAEDSRRNSANEGKLKEEEVRLATEEKEQSQLAADEAARQTALEEEQKKREATEKIAAKPATTPASKGSAAVSKASKFSDSDNKTSNDNDNDKEKRSKGAKASNRKKSDNSRGGGRKELHVAEDKRGRRKSRGPKRRRPGNVQSDSQHAFQKPTEPVIYEVEIPETIGIPELALRMSVKAADVIKTLMKMGVMVTINQPLDTDTATLVVEEMGHTPIEQKKQDVETEVLSILDDIEQGEKVPRAPIVTIMGHVDHGKTSLLDYIRTTRVADGEAGGITQHIGAYHVETDHGMITFLDTPGHAAFSAMRARGAKLTDIVILVVAADDGVKPQTIEAIQHSKAAGVSIIIAVNKMDKPEADPDRVRQELAQHEIVPEDWGGDTMFIEVSAKTGKGIPELLEGILLQSEVLELQAVKDGAARGVIVESSLDKGRGPVATVLIQSGTLKKGDVLVSGQEYGRVRAMFDESGQQVESAGPSIPVSVLGLSGVPNAGDDVMAVPNERKARDLAASRTERNRDTRLAAQKAARLDELFASMGKEAINYVNLVIKADVQGSVEAIRDSLLKIGTDDVKVRIVASGVGGINESDINLAATSGAVMIGFNVRADGSARRAAEEQNIELRYYSIIYEVIDEVKMALSGLLTPEIREEIVGLAEVRDVFRSSKLGSIAGSVVLEGVVKKDLPIRVLRDNVVIYEGALESLRRYKDDVSEVKSGTECGIGVKNYNDIKPGDQIEVFERTEIQRTLD